MSVQLHCWSDCDFLSAYVVALEMRFESTVTVVIRNIVAVTVSALCKSQTTAAVDLCLIAKLRLTFLYFGASHVCVSRCDKSRDCFCSC